MFGEDFLHECNTPFRRHIGQTDHPGVRRALAEYKLPEVFIHRHEHAPLSGCPCENHSVAGVRPSLARLDDIMTLLPQPFRETAARAPVDEEFHLPATRTASSVSWAMTACAYAMQARISSGSRSG